MRRALLACALVTAVGGSAAAAPLDAIRSFDDQELSPFGVDAFGNSVSISGSNVFVSDANESVNDGTPGRVYQFDATTGALLRTFDDPTPTGLDGFGKSISSEGDRVLIGASTHLENGNFVGEAHLFNSSTGTLLQTFNDPTPSVGGDTFGSQVSISGDNVLISAPFDNTNGQSSGQAHLFSASTGALLRTFNSPNPRAFDQFAAGSAVSGNNVVIGTVGDLGNGTAEGVVHLFSAVTGDLLQTFNDPTPTGADRFGSAVAASGDFVLVGAPRDTTNGDAVGQAYLFSAITGELLLTLDDPMVAGIDLFGSTLAIDGDKIVIGAEGDGVIGGQAFVFSATTGELLYSLTDPSPVDGDAFGVVVAISGDDVVVGVSGGSTQGQAHLFKLPPDQPGPGPVAVSEPTTLALFGLGLFGLGALRHRRNGQRA